MTLACWRFSATVQIGFNRMGDAHESPDSRMVEEMERGRRGNVGLARMSCVPVSALRLEEFGHDTVSIFRSDEMNEQSDSTRKSATSLQDALFIAVLLGIVGVVCVNEIFFR